MRAKEACKRSGEQGQNHFAQVHKMIGIGSGIEREILDFYLTRYACYLIAQNGDPSISEIAAAQTYFAVQTRKQELFEEMSPEQKRDNRLVGAVLGLCRTNNNMLYSLAPYLSAILLTRKLRDFNIDADALLRNLRNQNPGFETTVDSLISGLFNGTDI